MVYYTKSLNLNKYRENLTKPLNKLAIKNIEVKNMPLAIVISM